MFPKAGPPVLAAGGMVHGGHLASILALGASGVVFGTRFALSPESAYSDVERKALIEAKTSSTVRTVAFDEARNTLGWPRGIDGRGLRNSKCLFLPEVLQSEYLSSKVWWMTLNKASISTLCGVTSLKVNKEETPTGWLSGLELE